MFQNEGDNVLASDQAQSWSLAFERQSIAAVGSEGHKHYEFAGTLDTDELLDVRSANRGRHAFALDFDQWRFDPERVFMSDDIHASVLRIGSDPCLVPQRPQEIGAELLELAWSDAVLKYFKDEISGMTFDPGGPGLIGNLVLGGVAGRGLFDDLSDFFDVLGAGFEGGEEFVRVLADFEECQC